MNADQQSSLAILTPHFNGETRETMFSCKLCLEDPDNSRLIYGDWVDMQEHVHSVHKQNIDPEGLVSPQKTLDHIVADSMHRMIPLMFCYVCGQDQGGYNEYTRHGYMMQ